MCAGLVAGQKQCAKTCAATCAKKGFVCTTLAAGGKTLQVCLACTPSFPSAEKCDGRDNDCDGAIDEGACEDNNSCTIDICNAAAKACQHVPVNNGATCDADGSACTVKDSCKSGTCVAGAVAVCDDKNPCTKDSCDLAKGCTTVVHNGAPCEDANPCSVGDSCAAGKCKPGPAKKCDDGDVCTDDSCHPKTGCQTAHNKAACNDGNACTTKDTCAAGSCAGTKSDCNDGNACTADTCDEKNGCVAMPLVDKTPCYTGGGASWCQTGKCTLMPVATKVGDRDFAYWYWPGNHRPTETWPKVHHVMHFLTGYYAMAFDESTGGIAHFGRITNSQTMFATRHLSNAAVTSLPGATLQFGAGEASKGVKATSFLGQAGFTVDRSRMIDGGRFMNRVEIPTVKYAADSKLTGIVQVVSMPRHIVWNHWVKGGSAAAKVARISLGGAALKGLTKVQWLAAGRAVRLIGAGGHGWIFVVANDKQHKLKLSGQGGVIAERSLASVPKSGTRVSLMAIPTSAVNAAEQAMYVDPTNHVQASYTLLDLEGQPVGKPAPVAWDPTLGAFRVDLRPLQNAGAPGGANYEQAKFHNWYGRHRLELKRAGSGPISVPLAMHGPNRISWSITAGSPIWRDEKGDPLGVPVQISKNWHGQSWYHLYSQPTLPSAGTKRMELTVASARWGKVYAASHAQLSLIGWGKAGGHWDESAVGAFGESITYDPDVNLGRAMVDDIRPLLVRSDAKWNWSGNVGGADFLRYRTASQSYWERRMARVRSVYRATGPNLTDVTYAGLSSDGAIRGDMRAQLVATDDMVRVYYHLDYTFEKDVDYHTLAFFQVAADRYADNGFRQYGYGNAKGKLFSGTLVNHKATGYASDAHRGIAVPGEAPWALLYDSNKGAGKLPEMYANVGFVVRQFKAEIGGKTLTTPYLNITRTHNGTSQMAFQLGLPHTKGSPWCGAACKGKRRFIPKGSRVRATLEYVVLPAEKSRYYGTNSLLTGTAAQHYKSHELMRRIAAGNRLQVVTKTGQLTRTYPINVNVAPGALAADLTVEGGVGYTPITFRGLHRHDGWQLQRAVLGAWKAIDQSVHGADFWQADRDPGGKTWSLTFSVANSGKQRYRLVHRGCNDPKAPNYGSESDNGPCFACAADKRMSSRVTDCDWDCKGTWGDCFVAKAGKYCSFHYCEKRTACAAPKKPAVPHPYKAERAQILALGKLTAAPTMRAAAVGSTKTGIGPGQTKAIYFDALGYGGKPTRVFARIGLPAKANSKAPVPGVVLVHGGGGTAFSKWVQRWTERGYAAISIAVEGQTDALASAADKKAGLAVGNWRKHASAGPARIGAYGDTKLPLTRQWMYHAVADTILAHSLLAALPEVDAGRVGLMGISWGGVITATVLGIDQRAAFAVPTYGNGHKYDIPNYFGQALQNNQFYRQVWDPMVRMAKVTTPSLWLSWVKENNFSHDSQAATYLAAPGPRMVALVPGMGHGHGPGWNRPESYEFADSITKHKAPWCVQQSVGASKGVVQAVFKATRPLKSASLLYSTGSGWTGKMAWQEIKAGGLVKGAAGTWTVTAPLPKDATAWFINVKAAASTASKPFTYTSKDLVASSDYQEVINLKLAPAKGLLIQQPTTGGAASGKALISFTGPSYVEIVDVAVHSESHPGALCVGKATLPIVLKSPSPSVHALRVQFNNSVAGLKSGGKATGVLEVVWQALDGRMGHVQLPLSAVVVKPLDVVFDKDALWSSKAPYAPRHVTISKGAKVGLDVSHAINTLTVSSGTLQLDKNEALSVANKLEIKAGGTVVLKSGSLTPNSNMIVAGKLLIDGGTFGHSMLGVSRTISGGGLIEVKSGTVNFNNGTPHNVLALNANMRISGGSVTLSGQVYVGFNKTTTFEIIGNAAKVQIIRLNAGPGSSPRTFRFVLNANGVSMINVPGWMTLSKATIVVDGTAYTGGPAKMLLINSNNLAGVAPSANLKVTGFAKHGLKAAIVQDTANSKEWVQLVITKATP